MNTPAFTALALMSCLTLGGCKQRLTDQNLSCVKPDMNPKEVESILGQPNQVETKEMELQEDVKTLTVVRYTYKQDGKTVVLHFADGKLIGYDGDFEK